MGFDGRGAGRRDRVVRTRTIAVATATTAAAAARGAGAASADGAASQLAIRRRVSRVAAARGDLAVASGATAAAVAVTPAPDAVPAALRSWYVFRARGVLERAVASWPHRSRYAKLMHVYDALFYGGQPWRHRVPLKTTRRPVRG